MLFRSLEGAGAVGTPPRAGPPRAGLRLLPVRLSPVGAHSPPARGALPCLASPELALLLSPLFPRSSTFPAAAPPPRQVPLYLLLSKIGRRRNLGLMLYRLMLKLKIKKTKFWGAWGALSFKRLTRFQLRSRSHGSWVRAPPRALG